jgi:hypothetical protein
MASTSTRRTQGEPGPGPRMRGDEEMVGMEMWYWRSTSSTVCDAHVSMMVLGGWGEGGEHIPESGGRNSPRMPRSAAGPD